MRYLKLSIGQIITDWIGAKWITINIFSRAKKKRKTKMKQALANKIQVAEGSKNKYGVKLCRRHGIKTSAAGTTSIFSDSFRFSPDTSLYKRVFPKKRIK